jgi:hypothetical protein
MTFPLVGWWERDGGSGVENTSTDGDERKAFHVIYDPRRGEKNPQNGLFCLYGFFCPLSPFSFLLRTKGKTSEFNGPPPLLHIHSPLFFFSFFPFQAQIKILNLMDRKEKTAQALVKKKSSLMELEVQAQKVRLIFFSIAHRLLFLLSSQNVYCVNVVLVVLFIKKTFCAEEIEETSLESLKFSFEIFISSMLSVFHLASSIYFIISSLPLPILPSFLIKCLRFYFSLPCAHKSFTRILQR